MSFLFRAPERRDDESTRMWAQMREARSSSWAGVSVTPEAALRVPTVWRALQYTAGVISMLPLDEQAQRDGVWQDVRPSPLLSAPSGEVALEDWLFLVVESMILHGGAYGVIKDEVNGWPTQVELVPPRLVQTKRNRDGLVEWKFNGERVDPSMVWHVPGRPDINNQPFGLSLVDYMAETVAVGTAARRYASSWFAEGGAPVVVARPQADPGEDGALRLKEKIREALRTRAPAVIPQTIGLEEWKGSTPQDATLVDLLIQNATDVAAFFNLPSELIGGKSGDGLTYANLEQRTLDLLAFGVGYWLNKLEKALSRSIPRPRRAKFNEGAIVRTDIKTKTDTLVASVGGPFRTVDEGRAIVDLPPTPGGDTLRVPGAPTPAPQGGQQ